MMTGINYKISNISPGPFNTPVKSILEDAYD